MSEVPLYVSLDKALPYASTWYRVNGAGLWVLALEFVSPISRVSGFGFRVYFVGFRVPGLGFWVKLSGLWVKLNRFRIQGHPN